MEQQKQMSIIIGDSSKRKTSNIQSNDKSTVADKCKIYFLNQGKCFSN